jgi:hypothetical protein
VEELLMEKVDVPVLAVEEVLEEDVVDEDEVEEEEVVEEVVDVDDKLGTEDVPLGGSGAPDICPT